jgi:hypothetical protein|tara:strand:- start:205 stop:438 length:234 start_codon:yes stop_codon:yes gene_type:complete
MNLSMNVGHGDAFVYGGMRGQISRIDPEAKEIDLTMENVLETTRNGRPYQYNTYRFTFDAFLVSFSSGRAIHKPEIV